MQREALIAVAHRIGQGIVEQALWQDDACTWEVKTLDNSTGSFKTEVAGGGIYQGSGGIALFLGELFRLTGDAQIERTAEGGLRHALELATALPPTSFSFHGGRVGAAYLATRFAQHVGKPEYLATARQLLEPGMGHEGRDHGLDVIGGAAGAIPALLWLRHELADESLLEMACGLGDTLMAAARREAGGWSWSTVGPSATRNITGFAHGTSGAGLALLELYRATGRGRYRFAAEMAFLYERRLFDPTTSNWPDLRHREMNELYYSDRRDTLSQAEVADSLPDYQPRFMNAWCHGSPGIGLARVRAFELTGQQVYRQEAEAALKSTLAALEPGPGQGYSLCHGLGGNCELPLYAAEVFAEPFLREVCQRCAVFGEQTYGQTDVPWPCGTIEQVSDPSLLLGEAGIGYFYLRLASPETPSVLLMRPPLQDLGEGIGVFDDEVFESGSFESGSFEDGSFEEQSQLAVEEYFGQTLRAFEMLGAPSAAFLGGCVAGSEPFDTSPVEEAFASLRDFVDRQPQESPEPQESEARRALVEDAFRLERQRYELAARPNDLSRHFLRNLRRRPAEEVSWDAAFFGVAEDCLLVSTQWDWSQMAATDLTVGEATGTPPRQEQIWIIARQGEQVVTRRISPFAAALLSTMEPAASLEEIVDRLLVLAGGASSEAQRVEMSSRILHQLRELYRAGLVDEMSSTAASGQAQKDNAQQLVASA